MDKTIIKLSMLLVLIGALHIGLVGAFGFDLIGTILGTGSVAKLVYILVGVSAVYHLFTDFTKKLVK
jgi:uncharacterized membrane protein YuzA (DUF378 family)